MELVLASNNQGKLAEIKAMCAPWGIQVVTAASLGFTEEVAETGDTFEDNARLKAVAVSEALGRPALADDSGLVVEALNGAPGVHSARYAGEHGDDAANSAKLLTEMIGVPPVKRAAAFVCVMLCRRPDGAELVAQGRLEGRIAPAPAGHNGFGYDPVFLLPERGLTVAQLSAADKNAISHRGQALAKLAQDLRGFLGG
ncbi:MAG: XTP/dITP diphosphatase [Desulfarculus sp.]|nr:XTP/dITP diphosphatase [Pseudomonadota bacterium]MBV1714933.1 XTP/dITP diphosphatase [Desulfarculus sp.]MBU4576698.1 XTP/dITP diphosphatase [Pseudomonadota bacterium]MBU4599014.1 XTP/dITP diphosphatase [Pseudomonadota bacterium]MBV1737433.1 XTP/dITP diphosphatase [Desulfarculus sp.]